MNFAEWAARHPQAYAELIACTVAVPKPEEMSGQDKTEAYVQSRVRLEASERGVYLWRNNVGAGTFVKVSDMCDECEACLCETCRDLLFKSARLVRWGLANDSTRLNSEIKSGDLIGGKPTLITQEMVGLTILKFYSRECKREGWKWSGTEREVAQLAWATLINELGGDAAIVNSVGSL